MKTETLTASDGRTFVAEVVSQDEASRIGGWDEDPGEVLIVTDYGFCVAGGKNVDAAIKGFDDNKRVPQSEGPDEVLSLDDMKFYLVGDDVADAASKVMGAKDLDDLDDALDHLRLVCKANRRRDDEVIDMDALPTFGGKEPSDTLLVWSWDRNRLLVQNLDTGGFEIVDRDGWKAAA